MDTPAPIPILSPKLHVPPSRLQLVSRQRLLDAISSGLHRKLTLISAPAGYGKTTLLSEWAAQSEWQPAWITLADGDNDTERFLTYLIAAILSADPGLSNLQGVLGARFSLQPIPLEVLLAILVNELASTPERIVLVLDDYHVIGNQEIHSFVSSLIDHLPAHIHLVVVTRSDPPLRLAHWRAKDQLNEITERDLQFTYQETENFLLDVMGLRLTPDQVAELETRTEGWVTGLQLVGLSLKDRVNPTELISTLDGTHRYILDYLVEEVFTDLPPVLQTYLLRVSILDRLSPGLCDAVVGEPSDEAKPNLRSKEVLEFLDASNLFVVPLDSQRHWYRFHSLFADFLRDRLESRKAIELTDLHHRAATWYAAHGMLPEAVHHAFAAGDVGRAAALIEGEVKGLLGRGEVSTMLHWVEMLPEETVGSRPQLGLARAWGMLMQKPLAFRETADKQIHEIAQGLGIAPEGLLARLAETDSDTVRRALLGEFAMLLAFVGRDDMDVKQTIQLFKAAHDHLPASEALLRGFTLAGLASTYARIGEVRLAEETFAQAAETSLAVNSLFGYVACTDWQATMQAERGQLVRAAATYRQAIERLSGRGQHPFPLSGHAYVGLAGVLLEWNEMREALEAVNTGLHIGEQVGDIDALLAGYVIRARALLALDQKDESQAAMQEAEQQALNTHSLSCILDAQAQRADLALTAGEVNEAQRWASARGLRQSEPASLDPPLQEIEIRVYARLLMAEGRHAEALPLLADQLAAQEAMERMRAAVYNLALLAICYQSLRRAEEAVRTLARTLLLAEPEGYVRVFLEGGPPMAALLRTASAKGHSPASASRLLAAFGATGAEQDTSVEALSERELEVLHLAAQGLTNTQIADRLVIAQSTVKTHINRIYSKLGVRTRTQAVALARQRRILD